jgi:hypothetical protein
MKKLAALTSLSLLFSLTACGGESIEGTIYYKAVDEAWQLLPLSGQTMACDWRDDGDGPEASRSLLQIALKFDLDIKIDENKAQYEEAIDTYLKNNC